MPPPLSATRPPLLLLFLLLISVSASASSHCPPCGNLSVPYPFSTFAACGHPSYPLSCSPDGVLRISTLSGNYSVQSFNTSTRNLIVNTPPFVANTCITQDSLYPGNFSVDPDGPISVGLNNTVLVFNATLAITFTPMPCRSFSPCSLAFSVLPPPSCRQNSLCCSFRTAADVFRYHFHVAGIFTGYISVVYLDNTTKPEAWHQGLQLAWTKADEPPCSSHSDCDALSTCRNRDGNATKLHCLCIAGYLWDSTSGTCLRVPYCERRKWSVSCHRSRYAYGLTFGLLGFVVVTAAALHIQKKRRAAMAARAKLVKERAMILACNSGGKSARLFSNKEMKRATNNFAAERVLGCGAFGEVYRGVLDEGTPVAIKCAKVGNVKGVDQVLNEVRILSQVNHRSLVRLLGCCVEGELPLLVYEYVPNGNLYDHLHGGDAGGGGGAAQFLDWNTRLRIALQSAEGLAYLHSSAYPPIYHRDIKSSNILLDQSLNARVADFGISRLAEPDLTHVSTCAQGTLGYLDPEYYRNYQLTDKSDVYSFGVLLLEIVSSLKAIDFMRSHDHVNLAVLVQIKEEEGRLDDILDPRLAKDAPKEVLDSMKSVTYLALDCLYENRSKRPSMKEVVEILQEIIHSLQDSTGKAAASGH